MEEHNIVAFTDGSVLDNRGRAGTGAAVYMAGLTSSPVCLKKGINNNGNNYSGEIVGIEIALKHLSEYETRVNRSLHFFTDCQSAIPSAFGFSMPRYKMNIILNIRRLVAQLKDSGNRTSIHWIPGHRGFRGNEMVDSLAKKQLNL